jgi:hypothetical protein
MGWYIMLSMDSLSSILGAKKEPKPPSELKAINTYISEHFVGCKSHVSIKQTQIIITVDNAAFAGALRMHIHNLQALCKSNQKVFIRIG